MLKKLQSYVAIMLMMCLIISSLTPLSAKASSEHNLTFKIEEAMKLPDLNANFSYLDFEKLEESGFEEFHGKEFTENYTSSSEGGAIGQIILTDYNTEKYEFLGWRINDQVTLKDEADFTPNKIGLTDYTNDSRLVNGCIDVIGLFLNINTCQSAMNVELMSTGKAGYAVTVEPVFKDKSAAEVPSYEITLGEVVGGTATQENMGSNVYQLKATEGTNYIFKGWQKNDETPLYSEKQLIEVTLDAPTTFTPIFEKKVVTIELTDDAYIVQKSKNSEFYWGSSKNEFNPPASVGQRASLIFPYKMVGSQGVASTYTVNVYSGEGTTGELLTKVTNGEKTYTFNGSEAVRFAEVVIDPLPASGKLTVEVTINDQAPVSKTYAFDAKAAQAKSLSYMQTPDDKYMSNVRTVDAGPSILDMLSFVNSETGKLSVYAAAHGGVLELKGNTFEFMAGLDDLPEGDNESLTGMVVGIGGSKEYLVAVVKDIEDGMDLYSLYDYTAESKKWIRNEQSIIKGSDQELSPSTDGRALVLAANNIWTQKAHWDGEKWTAHNYSFSSFVKMDSGYIYAASNTKQGVSGAEGLYKYSNNEWVKIEIGEVQNPKLINISLDGTAVFRNGSKYYKITASGAIHEVANVTALYGNSAPQNINIDRKNELYILDTARRYVQMGTSGASGNDVYKFDEATNQWQYQDISAFNDPNEYAVGTINYLEKKVRPTTVNTIYNLADNMSIYAGDGGAVYSDFDDTTITFNSNGGSQVAPLTAKINSKINAPTAPIAPTTAEQYFAGWYIDKDLTKAYSFDYMPAKNIELFAKWIDKPVDLTQAKATANQTIGDAYKKYQKRDYDDEGWSALTKAKTDGLALIAEMTGSEDDVKTAMNKVLDAMSSVKINPNMTVAVSMEKFTLGQGYIIEPTLVTVPRNTQASKVITDLLVKKHGADPLPYKMTGNVETNFYLAHILDDGNQSEYKVPAYITDAIKADGKTINLKNDEWLGEFDFFENSGWMYAVNNAFPGVGAAGWTLKNDQVMRWQYTIYGLGADLNANNKQFGGQTIVTTAQKDNLTWRVAEINSMGIDKKKEFLAMGDNQEYFDNAYKVLTNMESTQAEVDAALKALGGADRVGEVVEVTTPDEVKVINDAIKALPTSIKLADKVAIEKIRKDYETLDGTLKQWIWKDEMAILEAAEKKILQLESEAKKVFDQIAALPLVANFKITDEAALKDAQTAYATLSKEQQELVSNATILTELTTKLASLKNGEVSGSVKTVIDLITLLPSKDALKLTDETSLKAAQAAYNALTTDQKLLVTNAAVLDQLSAKLTELKNATNAKNAQEVMLLIASLPDVSLVKLANETSVQSVKTAYDALTTEQKLFVTNSAKLTSLIVKMTELKQQQGDTEAVLNVTTLINNLPADATLTLAHKINVDYVRSEYNNLTLKQKSLVLNLAKLIEVEIKIASLATDVSLVISEINGLPKATSLTIQHKPLIETIRAAYNKLSSSQKIAVTNYMTLIEAEMKIASLKDTDEKPNASDVGEIPADFKEAVAQSTGIHSIKESKNQLAITAQDDAKDLLLTLSNEMVQQIRENEPNEVIITTADDVSINIPYTVFEETLARKSSLLIEATQSRQGRNTALQLNITEVLSNGIERSLVLHDTYVQVTLALSDFTNRAVASLKSVAASKSNGVIVRLVDGEYKAVPHVINGDKVVIYANGDAKYVYLDEEVTFDDIKQTGAKEDIEFLASRYVVQGTSPTTYSPNKSITRAQFGAMIARSLNLVANEATVYKDTKGQWYEADIQALYEAGITNATGNFNPNAPLTREHAAAFMYRVLEYIQKDELTSSKTLRYRDSADVQTQFVEAVATLYRLGIMEGKDNNRFDPKGHLTRAQMAKILRRTLEEINMM